MARTLADVKKAQGKRDVVALVREALKGIPKGEYENSLELFNRAGVSTKDLPVVQPKLAEFSVAVKNAAAKPAWMWARTPADAKKLHDALKSQNG